MATNTRATRTKKTSATSDTRKTNTKSSQKTKKTPARKVQSHRQKKNNQEDETNDDDDGSEFALDPNLTQNDSSANNQTSNLPRDEANNDNNSAKPPPIFRSRFPGLEMDNFEDYLDDWTLVTLRQAIFKQAATSSRAHSDIQALVKTIRLQYEKRMLMVALMGGVPETVIWNIVGEGSMKRRVNRWLRFLAFCKLALDEKLPALPSKQDWVDRNKSVADAWKKLSKEEKIVFEDPYFFALAKLPDLSNYQDENLATEDMDEEDLTLQHLDTSTSAPKIYQLSEADKIKYQPLFDRLVDVTKVHSCYGKPPPSTSVATLQKRSYAELRKAHHDFSVVCQRYQIAYYLTAVSCGSTDGWSQVFSNNVSFAKWARETAKVPSKFETYIHGKSVSEEIEGSKVRQPSDERKIRLGRQLNSLVDAVHKGNIFPKVRDPVNELKIRGWPIRIIQKEGSLLSKDELEVGHRDVKDSSVKLWLQDIENKRFVIESIPEAERLKAKAPKKQSRKRKQSQKSASHHSDSGSENDGRHSENRRSEESRTIAQGRRAAQKNTIHLSDSHSEEEPEEPHTQLKNKKRHQSSDVNPTQSQSQDQRRNQINTAHPNDSHSSEEESELRHAQPKKKQRRQRSASRSDSSSHPPKKKHQTQRPCVQAEIEASTSGHPPNQQSCLSRVSESQPLTEEDMDGSPIEDDF